MALAAATERLLNFRKFEYNLFLTNHVAAPRSGSRAAGAVSRPSITVLNKINDSALFEFVTYEFAKRPQLVKLISQQEGLEARRKRRKRSARSSINIVSFESPFNQPNQAIVRKVKNRLESLPSGHNFYITTTTKQVDLVRFVSSSPSRVSSIIEVSKCFPSEENQPCNAQAKYRTYSGWCNNLNHPEWGQGNQPHRRLLPSAYADGISEPKARSVMGHPLPNPRKVSQGIHSNEVTPDPKYTLMLMQWGQFVDHDLTHTPVARGHDNSVLECRDCNSQNVHPACLPIRVPEDDSFFAFNRQDPKCIPFTRSINGQKTLGTVWSYI